MTTHNHEWELIAVGLEGCRKCTARREIARIEAFGGDVKQAPSAKSTKAGLAPKPVLSIQERLMDLQTKIAKRIEGHLPVSPLMTNSEFADILAQDLLELPEIKEALRFVEGSPGFTP